MKSMNVKKLVALGVAAAIAAMPVAHAAQTFNTSALPTAKDWYLNSVVVVGHASAPSDAVWAGNIAAAIANMAYTEETKTVTADIKDAKVKLSISGQVVVGDNGYATKKHMEFDKTDVGTVTVGTVEVPKFVKKEISYSYKDGSGNLKEDTVTADESVTYTADFAYYKDSDAKELYPVLEISGVEYKVTFTPGLPAVSADANDLKGLEIPILGETYTITAIDPTNKAITFVTAGDEHTFQVGEEYDFEGHKVKLVDVAEDGKSVLVDVDGEQKSIPVNQSDTVGGIKVYVKDAFVGKTVITATLRLGAEEKKYTDGDLWKDMDNWQFKVYTSGGLVTGIGIKYIGSPLQGESALKEGEAFKIADTDYAIKFYGHDTYATHKIDFSSSKLTIYGGTSGNTYSFDYYDYATVNVPAASVPDNEVNSIVTPVTLNLGDGISIKMDVNAYTIDANTDSTGTSIERHYAITLKQYKLPGMTDYEDVTGTTYVDIDGSTSVDVNVTGTTKTVTLSINLDRDSADTKEVKYLIELPDWSAAGSETLDVVLQGVTSGSEKFISDDREVNVALTGTWGGGNDEYEVYLGDGDAVFVPVYFDTTTHSTELNVDDLGVGFDYDGDNTAEETLKPDYYTDFYTENFDKVTLSPTDVTIEVPTKIPNAYAWAGILGGVEEQENVYEKGVGETLTIGDYQVKIEDITAEGATATYTEVKPIKLDRLVYLDNEVPSGKNLIVVGGYFVNSIAEAIANEHPEIKDAVAQAGDYIVDKYTYNGKDAILVFGYTAEDTATAAQQFLNWLKSNVQ